MSAIDTFMRAKESSQARRDERSAAPVRAITSAVGGIGQMYAEHQAKQKLKDYASQRYGIDPNDPGWDNPESTKALFIDADRKERASKALKALGMESGAATPPNALQAGAIPSYIGAAAGGAPTAKMPRTEYVTAEPPAPAPPQPQVGGMDRMALLRRGLGEGMDPRDAMLLTGVLPKGADPMTPLDEANAAEARARAAKMNWERSQPQAWQPTTWEDREKELRAQHPVTPEKPRRTVTAEDVARFNWPQEWIGADSADAIAEAGRRGLNAPPKEPLASEQVLPPEVVAQIEKALNVEPGTLAKIQGGLKRGDAGAIPMRQGESPEATEMRRLRLQTMQADAASLEALLKRRANDPAAQTDLANLIALKRSASSGQMGAGAARKQLMEAIPTLMQKYGMTPSQPAAGDTGGQLPPPPAPPPPGETKTAVDPALKAEFDAFPAPRQQELLNKMSAEEKARVGR